jgi:LacI family gluconate utilization system Gnt-I transcriptional repressor
MAVPPKFTESIITLADVAKAANVGESTASRVLRNKGSFSEEARARVLSAARKLHYVPNRIAGTLASTDSHLVGVIIPGVTTTFFPDLLLGANSVLESAGIQSVISVTEYDATREEKLIESLLSWRPAGILVTGLEHTDRSRAMLKAARTRVVELGDIDGQGIDIVVGFSNRAAGYAAGTYLIKRRFRRIGYVGNQSTRAGKRYEGFKAALADAGMAITDQEVSPGLASIKAGRDGLMRLLKRKQKLDVVYFANDDMAIGGYFHCLATGISIPDHLAILGHNGSDEGQLMPLPLSTVRAPRLAVGQVGARLLLSNGPSQVIDLGFELNEGMTT